MNTSEIKKIRHVSQTIAIGFIGAFTGFAISMFFPPDNSTDPPTYPLPEVVLQEISVALFIFGCTVMGIKLAEEKKTLPAAGFTMMSIAQGVYFILYFTGFDNTEVLKETYNIFCGFIYLFLPAMILIAFYGEFPRWVNLLGIASLIPNIIVYYKYMSTQEYTSQLDVIGFFSFILINITSLIWGIFILRNARKEIKSIISDKI